MATEKKHIITAIVKNESGVLTRISGLFARRCFNIDSLVVCDTEEPSTSRITIVAHGDDVSLSQIVLQLDKLADCLRVSDLDPSEAVMRELMLIKVAADTSKHLEIESICRTYNAKIVDLSPLSAVIELTGKSTKVDGFIEVMRSYGIIELSRTGLVALERGEASIKN